MSDQGEMIFEKRKELEISQIDLANTLGFSSQFMGRIESGAVSFPAEHVKKLCKTLRLSPIDFVDAVTEDYWRRYMKKTGLA